MQIKWGNDVDEDGQYEEGIFDEENGGERSEDIMSWLQRSVRGKDEVGPKLFEEKDVDRKYEER